MEKDRGKTQNKNRSESKEKTKKGTKMRRESEIQVPTFSDTVQFNASYI